MHLVSLGINHHTAPVALREQVAIGPEQLPDALTQLCAVEGVREASILSTCNRTELFVAQEEPDRLPALEWFRARNAGIAPALQEHLVFHSGLDVARHLFRVAGGLDSMLLGETQILGQVKQAYRDAREIGTIGKLLNRLYQQTFAVAKQVRSDTAIGASPVSVAFAAVSLARQIFSDIAEQRALVIGAGDTAELVIKHLRGAGLQQLTIANRTLARAQRLAQEYQAQAITLAMLPAYLARSDILVTSTNSELPLVGKGMVERAIRERRRQPIFMVDLAVPRDIEAEVESLSDVYLYTVDDLQQVVAQNQQSRQTAVTQAECIIDEQVSSFGEWLQTQRVVPLVRQLRGSLERLRDRELASALQALERGRPAEEVVSRLAYRLTRKAAHTPSVMLRQAGEGLDPVTLQVLAEILGQDEH